MLPKLTVNRQLMNEFIAADPPCFALGMVEERGRRCGFLALQPGRVIPPAITNLGFRFGHSLLGNADFEVIHFAFAFYGSETYNVLLNPSNPLVHAIVTAMVKSGDYFFFMPDPNGSVTAFRSSIGEGALVGLKTDLPRIQRSTTTEMQYRKAVSQFEKHPEPPGILLNWVCRENVACLDLGKDRLDMTGVGE